MHGTPVQPKTENDSSVETAERVFHELLTGVPSDTQKAMLALYDLMKLRSEK